MDTCGSLFLGGSSLSSCFIGQLSEELVHLLFFLLTLGMRCAQGWLGCLLDLLRFHCLFLRRFWFFFAPLCLHGLFLDLLFFIFLVFFELLEHSLQLFLGHCFCLRLLPLRPQCFFFLQSLLLPDPPDSLPLLSRLLLDRLSVPPLVLLCRLLPLLLQEALHLYLLVPAFLPQPRPVLRSQSVLPQYLFLVLSDHLLISLQPLEVLRHLVAAVDSHCLVLALRLELLPEAIFFAIREGLPVLVGQLGDLQGGEVLVLLGVLQVALLDEPAVGREDLAPVGEQLVLDLEGVPLPPPDLVHLEVVVLLLGRQVLPLLRDEPGEGVHLDLPTRAFLGGAFEEEAHVGVHGPRGRLQLRHPQLLLQLALVLLVAVLLGLHSRIINGRTEDAPVKSNKAAREARR